MTYVELAAALALMLVLCLAAAVWRLASQVRRLADDVVQLRRDYPPNRPAAATAPSLDRRPGAQASPSPPGVGPVETLSEQRTGEPVPVITRLADETSAHGDASTSRVASVTLGPPLIKVAAFAYGVRRALADEQRMRVSHAVHKELRRQRRLRRRRRRDDVVAEGVTP